MQLIADFLQQIRSLDDSPEKSSVTQRVLLYSSEFYKVLQLCFNYWSKRRF